MHFTPSMIRMELRVQALSTQCSSSVYSWLVPVTLAGSFGGSDSRASIACTMVQVLCWRHRTYIRYQVLTVASGHRDQLQTADPRRPPESISRSQVPPPTNVTYGFEKIDWSNQYFLDSFEDRPCQRGVLLTNRTYAILEPTP